MICPPNCTACTVNNSVTICTTCVNSTVLVRGVCYVPRTAIIDIYMPRSISTCFVGTPCNVSECIGLRNDANELIVSFNDDMQTVPPGSPSLPSYPLVECLTMTMNDTEMSEVRAEFEVMRSNVANWTFGALLIQLRYHAIGDISIQESRWGGGVWVAPWDVRDMLHSVLMSTVGTYPDFNMFIAPIRDPIKQLHHDLGGCGGTFGGDFGLAGAGWSWVPKTASSFWFECAIQQVLTHEWLHQVHWDVHVISPGFTDIYNFNLPPCGQYVNDTYSWFPDSHQCNEDPDFERCGLNDCGDNDIVNSHILRAHWDPARPVVFNYCNNNIADLSLGESGVDVGPECIFA